MVQLQVNDRLQGVLHRVASPLYYGQVGDATSQRSVVALDEGNPSTFNDTGKMSQE